MVTCNANAAEVLPPVDSPETLLALLVTPGVGVATVYRVRALARALGESLPAWLGQPESRLIRRLPPGAIREANALAACSPVFQAHAARLIKRTLRAGVKVVCDGEPAYPAALAQATGHTAPPLLFLRGNTSLFGPLAAGIVGTRSPTPPGREMAAHCARIFAARRVPVISGAAAGVDTDGHLAALRAGGVTTAILPQGILTCPLCAPFQTALAEGRLLLVSEFPPDALWQRHAAITRNATISALSHLLCVIEPSKEGGSIQTARHALREDKPVFFLPRRGAIPVTLTHGPARPLSASFPTLTAQLAAALQEPAHARAHQSLLF